MRISTDGKLKKKLYAYIEDIRRAIKENRTSNKTNDIYDYPSIVIGCEYNSIKKCGRSNHAHKRVSQKFPRAPFNIRVTNALKRINSLVPIPGVYKDTDGKVHFLGTCAEDDAANKVLNTLDSSRGGNPKLGDLSFTRPIRPRTYSYKSNCDVCKQVFK